MRVVVRLADATDCQQIYRLRHEVYAAELGQHACNEDRVLCDALDGFNHYILAADGNEILAFISITPPGANYSLDKYLPREAAPFIFDAGLYEVRLLTVVQRHRSRMLAPLLMYAALRYVETQGGTRVMAIGRREVLDLYVRVGLRQTGRPIHAGAVEFELLHAAPKEIRRRLFDYLPHLRRLEQQVEWQLPFAFQLPVSCYHGGAFWDAVGNGFESLARAPDMVTADVLDAWFPPAPAVLDAVREHLPYLLRTSPPTGCEGMVRAVAAARGVPQDCVLPAAGSSALIFLAFREWLSPHSRVLLLDPTYGEYSHVLENVVGCHVARLPLLRENRYRLQPETLAARLREDFDFVVLVNPNSPTGTFLCGGELRTLLGGAPGGTRAWIDETYLEYIGGEHSLEQFAAQSGNIFVCKSMSKAYALSGARAAYLCGPQQQVARLRGLTPPWAVSLVAQVAAVAALGEPDYYRGRYSQTIALRAELAQKLSELGIDVIPGNANFLLCHLPESGLSADAVVLRCRGQQVFLRDASTMGTRLGRHALRVTVRSADENQRVVAALASVLECAPARPDHPMGRS